MTKQLITGKLDSIASAITTQLKTMDSFEVLMGNSAYNVVEIARQRKEKLDDFALKIKGKAQDTLNDIIGLDVATVKREAGERVAYSFPDSQTENYSARTAYFAEKGDYVRSLEKKKANEISELYDDLEFTNDGLHLRMIEEFIDNWREDEQGIDVVPLRARVRHARDSRVSPDTKADIEFLKSLVSVRHVLESVVRNVAPSATDLAALARVSLATVRPLILPPDYSPVKLKK